jgi:hypothetical protein
MFAAYGDQAIIEQLRDRLAPYLTDGQRTAAAIAAAEPPGSSSTTDHGTGPVPAARARGGAGLKPS